jgi:hypothetical protein
MIPNVPRILQTKYWLAIGCFLVASIALFVAKATFAEWATFMAVLFGLYGSADIYNTHLQQKKNIPPESQTS